VVCAQVGHVLGESEFGGTGAFPDRTRELTAPVHVHVPGIPSVHSHDRR
jgi:hypothetical protein